MSFTIAVASDHAGYAYKTMIAAHLSAGGHNVVDLGTDNPDRVDYPDFGKSIGEAVASGQARFRFLMSTFA